jgi:hypothetical protein
VVAEILVVQIVLLAANYMILSHGGWQTGDNYHDIEASTVTMYVKVF